MSLLVTIATTTSPGCTFAVQHPAATAAIVGGTVGLGTCAIGTDFTEAKICAEVGAGAALVLGGVVLLATWLGGDGDTVLRSGPAEDERPVPQDPSLDAPLVVPPPPPPPPVTPPPVDPDAPAPVPPDPGPAPAR